jgi:anti-anti-sigma factor
MMPRKSSNIKVHSDGDMATIEVLDDLTASSEDAMKEAYHQACEYDPSIILFKFDPKNRINSGGIAILISVLTQSQRKGQKVFITGISEGLWEIFDLVGLNKYATIVESEEDITDS